MSISAEEAAEIEALMSDINSLQQDVAKLDQIEVNRTETRYNPYPFQTIVEEQPEPTKKRRIKPGERLIDAERKPGQEHEALVVKPTKEEEKIEYPLPPFITGKQTLFAATVFCDMHQGDHPQIDITQGNMRFPPAPFQRSSKF